MDLSQLDDHILCNVLANLESPADKLHLAATCRRLERLLLHKTSWRPIHIEIVDYKTLNDVPVGLVTVSSRHVTDDGQTTDVRLMRRRLTYDNVIGVMQLVRNYQSVSPFVKQYWM